MSLKTVPLSQVVKQQFARKLKAYSGYLTSLVIFQVIAILLSLGNGATSINSTSGGTGVSIEVYSADNVLSMTLLWSFITGILITNKYNREIDLTFISSRLSMSLSNIAYLLMINIAAALTVVLSGFLLKLNVRFSSGSEQLLNSAHLLGVDGWSKGVAVILLVLFLTSALGYFLGVMASAKRAVKVSFYVLLAAFFIVVMLTAWITPIETLWNVYADESSFVLFAVKMIVTAAALFSLATYLIKKQEVRVS